MDLLLLVLLQFMVLTMVIIFMMYHIFQAYLLHDEYQDNFIDINYIAIDNDGSGFDGGGGASQSTIEQGLYLLKGSCIYLENESF